MTEISKLTYYLQELFLQKYMLSNTFSYCIVGENTTILLLKRYGKVFERVKIQITGRQAASTLIKRMSFLQHTEYKC